MIIIADSGSTKTDWSVVDDNNRVTFFQTQGFNPYFNDTETIISGLKKDFPVDMDYSHIEHVHYYGAGCSTEKNCDIIYQSLKCLFANSMLSVSDDLLGAARSLFGNKHGIACILGTGSNSGYYDGQNITERQTSYGYLFGDEGSGAHLGKRLIQDYLSETMPQEIKEVFDKKYAFTLGDILEGVYKNPYPNRFLASFTAFLSENLSYPYIEEMVKISFSEFFDKQLKKYATFGKSELACVGSVAYYFREIFQTIADENNIKVARFSKNPVRGLIRYHCGIELR